MGLRVRSVAYVGLGCLLILAIMVPLDAQAPPAFQRGMVPAPAETALRPGETAVFPVYCLDLLSGTPDQKVAFLAQPGRGEVWGPNYGPVTIGQAQVAGSLSLRGCSPAQMGRLPIGYFGLQMTNRAAFPLRVFMPAGLVVVPAGQEFPNLPWAMTSLLQAICGEDLSGSESAASAVWAARGFTREDAEHTLVRPLTENQAVTVQRILDSSELAIRFDRNIGTYAQLFQEAKASLGNISVTGNQALAMGRGIPARVYVAGNASGQGVAHVAALVRGAGYRFLYYGARIAPGEKPGEVQVTLLHLRTGRPLEAIAGPLQTPLD